MTPLNRGWNMKQRILIIFLCVIWSTALYGQSTVESFTEQLEKNWSKYPNELTYIQTSKGIYETGEDLWFKAYQLDVQTMGLSNRSKTFYLQMVDTKDSIVWQEKYHLFAIWKSKTKLLREYRYSMVLFLGMFI